MEPRIPKESAPFDTDGRWTRTWIMYFESLFDLSVKEAVREAGTVTHTDGDLTLDMPVFGNGEDDVKVGTKSGNTNEVATVAGAVVTGNTVQWDADGNLIDAGVTPGGGGGGGGVSSVTGTAPIASSGGATPNITIAAFTGDSGSGGAKGAVPAPAAGDAAANKVLGAGGGWVAGGSGGTPAYISSLIAGPDTTKTITGATHGYATAGLLVQVYDNASPRNAIAAGWTVNSSTFDVIITFASPQSNYYVVINGATGPAGPTGPPGSGSGTVTSVALTVPAEFSVSGSPVTTSGTLAVSKATQSANAVYAGPTTGSAAAPTFRAVVPADLPLASSSAFGAVKVDGTTITAASGVISAVSSGGGGWPFLPPQNPPTSSWTWVNQGSSTVTTNSNGNLYIQFANAGSNTGRGYLRSKPGTNYTIIIGMRSLKVKVPGIAMYDSVSDKLVCSFFDFSSGPTAFCFQYNASSYSFNTREFADITEGIDMILWQKIVEDASHRTFYLSPDGYNWFQYAQVANATYITPTHVGIGCDCSLSAGHGNAAIFYFSLTSP